MKAKTIFLHHARQLQKAPVRETNEDELVGKQDEAPTTGELNGLNNQKIKWAQKYDQCIRCGRNDLKHVAQGLCAVCYEEESNLRNRGHKGSGQSFNKKLTEYYLFKEYVEEKRSTIDIAKEAGYTRQAVSKALKKFGIAIRSQSESSELAFRRGKKIVRRLGENGNQSLTTLEKTDVNENFFSSWSSQMAYVLGLIYTDGNVSPGWKYGDPKRKSNRMASVKISQKEPELLQKACFLMDSNARLRYHKEYRYGQTVAGALYTLEFNNGKLYEDLLSLGVTPRKSLTLSFPEIPSEFVRHFLRGCWDGDGTVHVSSRGSSQSFAGIVSGSKQFLNGIVSQLYEIGIMNRIDHCPVRMRPNGSALDIRIKGRENLTNLFHYLYDDVDSSMRLDRKYQNFVKLIESYESDSE